MYHIDVPTMVVAVDVENNSTISIDVYNDSQGHDTC